MRIIGIDPGYERLGIAVIDQPSPAAGYGSAQKNNVVFSTCIRTSAKLSMPDRLHEIGTALSQIIKEHAPDEGAIEELYFGKSAKTGMLVAEARGVIQYVLRAAGVPVFQYHPSAIKIAITGNGNAKKEDILFMLPKLIDLSATKKLDDELDAIAVAITHLSSRKVIHN
jgi:crossover junction endodeoxyribonuclease RuvC